MSNITDLSAFLKELQRLQLNLAYRMEQLTEDLGLAAGPRLILEWIAENPGLTVPEIARMRHVSRQHIQVQVNALYERGYIEALSNPDHARSYKYRLTKGGQKAYKAIKARLEYLLEPLANQEGLAMGSELLEQFSAILEDQELEPKIQAAQKKFKL